VIERLKLTYLPAEDRLELCIFAAAPNRVHRLHLTRRVTRGWLEQIARIVELSAQPPASAQPEARAAIARLHHEALAAKVTYAKSSGDDALQARAAAAPARLVTALSCGRSKQDGRWILHFSLAPGEAVSLALSAETLHGLVQLLAAQLQSTDWQLDLPVLRAPVARAAEGVMH